MRKPRSKRLPQFDQPHRDYARQWTALERLFIRDFPNPQRSLATLLLATQIPFTTLYHWNARWRSNPDWRPWNPETHRLHHHIFTREEEEVITDHIIADYIAIGQLFTDQEFRQVAMDAFLAKYNEADAIPPFNCSDRFISDFKERNHFSSRRAHDKRRPTSDPAIVDQWLAEIRDLLMIAPFNHIVNCDKSQWDIHSHGLRI
jgi:hypothetical protein